MHGLALRVVICRGRLAPLLLGLGDGVNLLAKLGDLHQQLDKRRKPATHVSQRGRGGSERAKVVRRRV